MAELIYREESYAIVGCCMEVYNILGHGFLEAVYQEALARELKRAGIPFRREVPLEIFYKGEPLNKSYFADFICFEKIIVETKALPTLLPAHAAQVFNYLKATRLQLGLLVNFGCTEKLQYSRHINLPRTSLNARNTDTTNSTNLTNQDTQHPSNSLNPSNPCLEPPPIRPHSSDPLNPSDPCLKTPPIRPHSSDPCLTEPPHPCYPNQS